MLLLIVVPFIILAIAQGQSLAQSLLWEPGSLQGNQPYWPYFGYDRQNTSRSPYLGPGAGPVKIVWHYEADKGRVINQQPTVDKDGTVYFATWGSVDKQAGDYAHGKLYAVNPDGTLKWEYDPGPADCPRKKTWCYGTIETSPVIGPDGTIYFGRGDGVLRAVNPDGTEKWEFGTYINTNGRGQILSSPAVTDEGVIYFGTIANWLNAGYGTNAFYAIKDMGDHAELLWTYPSDAMEGGTLNKAVWSQPAIGPDGTVYFAAGHTIYALNPDGTERWHKLTLYEMYTPVVGPDGTIYVQARGTNGMVYALNPDGTKKWTFTVGEGETIASKVSIGSDGTLYVGSGTRDSQLVDDPQNVGKLYALTDCGQNCVEEKWTSPLDLGSSAVPSAIDEEGIIYVALRGDLGVAGKETDPPVHGRVVAVRDLGDHGEILWSVEVTGEIWMGNPVIGPDRTLYLADAVCIHDPLTGTDCDQDTQVPSLYAIRPSYQIYLPLVMK